MSEASARILLYGSFRPENYEYCWWKWLLERGYTVSRFPRGVCFQTLALTGRWRGLCWRFTPGLLAHCESEQFLRAACEFRPNLVLVVSGNLVTPRVLRDIRAR